MAQLCLRSALLPPPVPASASSRKRAAAAAPRAVLPKKRARAPNERLFASLSRAQRAAVFSPLGVPLAIVAAAGSGKTTTLSARIAHMLQSGCRPESIVAISFTRKSCDALRKRVNNERLEVRTFHSFCLHLLQRYPALALRDAPGFDGSSVRLKVLSTREQREVVVTVLKAVLIGDSDDRRAGSVGDRTRGAELDADFGADAHNAAASVGGARTSSRPSRGGGRAKAAVRADRGRGLFARRANAARSSAARGHRDAAAEEEEDAIAPRTLTHFLRFLQLVKGRGKRASQYPAPYGAFLSRYERAIRAAGSVDFADLVPLAVRLLQRHPDVLVDVRRSIQYVLVDEFQDANAGQLELLRVLGGAWKRPASASAAFGADADGSSEPPSVTVCGDDDQAIYGFRGATIDAFGLFVKSFPMAKRVVLGVNYRSSALIVKASTSVIAHNKGRQPKVVVAAPSWSPTHLTLGAPRVERHVFPADGASLPASLKIKMLCCKNAAVEVKQICDAVRKRFNAGASFGHIAVLGRTRAVTRGIALELRRCRVPTTDRNFRALGERRGAGRGDRGAALRNLQHYVDLVVAVDALGRGEAGSGSRPLRPSAAAALDASFIAVCDAPRRGVGAKVLRALRGAQRAEQPQRSLLELALAKPARSRALGEFVALLAELRAHVNSAQLDPATATAEIHRRSGLLEAHNGDGASSGECSFMYRYILRESRSQFDSLPQHL